MINTDMYIQMEKILNIAENHSEIDFKTTLINEYINSHNPQDSLTRTPTIYNVIEVVLYNVLKYIFLLFFTLLPIVIVFFLRGF